MSEFTINSFITLKLEDGKTNIYVLGELFIQCKYLLMNIPIQDIERYDEINSIDEAAEKLDKSLERGNPEVFTINIIYDKYYNELPRHWESNVALFNGFSANINKHEKEITLPS